MFQIDTFAFEATEEVFGDSVVIRVALAGHALTETEIRQTRAISTDGILDAAIRVEDKVVGRVSAADGGIQRSEGKVRVDAVREGIATDLPDTQIFDSSEIEPSLVGRDAGDIANPGFV